MRQENTPQSTPQPASPPPLSVSLQRRTWRSSGEEGGDVSEEGGDVSEGGGDVSEGGGDVSEGGCDATWIDHI